MKCLVTGYPGSGKSEVAEALQARGLHVYDTELLPNYTRVEEHKTGRPIAEPAEMPPGWFGTIGAYNWDRSKIKILLTSDQDLFICALATNQSKFYKYFDRIFILSASDETLIKRLESRSSKSFGKEPNQLADILATHRRFEQAILKDGAIAIDANQPIDHVVSAIVSHCVI